MYQIEVSKIRSEIQYWLRKSPKMGAPHIPRALEQNDCNVGQNVARLQGVAILAPFFLIAGLLHLKMIAQLGEMVQGYRDGVILAPLSLKCSLTLSTFFLFFTKLSWFFHIGKWCPNLSKLIDSNLKRNYNLTKFTWANLEISTPLN